MNLKLKEVIPKFKYLKFLGEIDVRRSSAPRPEKSWSDRSGIKVPPTLIFPLCDRPRPTTPRRHFPNLERLDQKRPT